MDAPIYAFAAALAAILGAAICSKYWKPATAWRLAPFAAMTLFAYLVIGFLGEFIVGWGHNQVCYHILGCNTGFYGYDAAEHFLFGMAAVIFFLWIMRLVPRLSLVQDRLWKSALMLFSLVAVAAVVWEMLECADDYYHIVFLHETLFSFTLHINKLDQSSNFDTMGDLTFGLLGAITSIALIIFADRKELKK